MAINNIVVGPNLGDEFDIGNIEANKIRLKTDGTTIVRAGDGTFSSPGSTLSYNAGTQILTHTPGGGTPSDIDLSGLAAAADIYVDGATFDAATSTITLTDTDGTTPDVEVDLSSLLGASADAGNLLADGADDKPLLTAAALCTAVTDNCLDDCVVTDVFGATIGTVQMLQ